VNLENTLNYLTHHSEAIIQWLFLSILLLSGFLIARWLFGKKEGGASAAIAGATAVTLADGGDIQTFLKKIMDQTAKLESMPMDKMTPAAAGEVDAQVQALKKDLQAREEELKALKAAGDGKPSEDAGALAARIKELESKLAEYEILEDDIADLSLYKEENARLRAELEKQKGGGADSTGAAPAPAAPPAAETASSPAGEDLVAELAQAVAPSEPAPKPAVEVKETGDPMTDFENVVAAEKKLSEPTAAAAPAVAEALPAPEVLEPVVQTPAPATSAAVEGDDLFAEFANPPAETAAEGEGSLDTDKMMAEMAQLVSIDTAAGAGGSALEENSDIEKMAAEATNLSKS
jgi:hypothetical protein